MISRKISVILPTYNRSGLLSGALDSVLKQDYDNMEVVVVDDGSSDGTEELMRGYLLDKRVSYVKNSENIGCHLSIRKALYDHTNGQYCFIMSDDHRLLDPEFFKKSINALVRDGSKLAFSNYIVSFFFRKSFINISMISRLKPVLSGEEMYFGWQNPYFLNTATVFFDREFMIAYLNPYNNSSVYGDQELWLRTFLSPGLRCSFIDMIGVSVLSHKNCQTGQQSVEKFIEGLSWCSSTEELAMTFFDPKRVKKQVDFLLTNTLLSGLGPIVRLRNVISFFRLLKGKNPRAYRLLLIGLLRRPWYILKLFVSGARPVYNFLVSAKFFLLGKKNFFPKK